MDIKDLRKRMSRVLAYWRISQIGKEREPQNSPEEAKRMNAYAMMSAGADFRKGLPSYAAWGPGDVVFANENSKWWIDCLLGN